MQKKDTTTKQKRASDDAAAELARHISAILNNPSTPACVYNAPAEAVNDSDAPKGYYHCVEHPLPLLAGNIKRGDTPEK